MRQLLYFLFAIGIVFASSSCKKETPELPENYIAYKKQNYDIEKLSVTYFGSRMSVLEFSLPDSSTMELTITNGTLDSLTEGKYVYGTIDMGFRMVLKLNNEEIKAKNGSVQIICDEATKHYTFEFDITTQADLQVQGNYNARIDSIYDKSNSLIIGDKILPIEGALSFYLETETESFNYLYLFTEFANPYKDFIGFIFYSYNSRVIEEGYLAWGSQFGSVLFASDGYEYESSGGRLWVDYLGEGTGGDGLYDVFFSVNCNQVISGSFLGEINLSEIQYKQAHNKHNTIRLPFGKISINAIKLAPTTQKNKLSD